MNVSKKGDFIIIGVTVAIFVVSIGLLFSFSKQGNRVVIKQNNEIVYNQSLKNDNTVDVGTNCVTIKNGEVFVSSASCKNQICVNTGKISKKGESIVCLPNKVIVEIK